MRKLNARTVEGKFGVESINTSENRTIDGKSVVKITVIFERKPRKRDCVGIKSVASRHTKRLFDRMRSRPDVLEVARGKDTEIKWHGSAGITCKATALRDDASRDVHCDAGGAKECGKKTQGHGGRFKGIQSEPPCGR